MDLDTQLIECGDARFAGQSIPAQALRGRALADLDRVPGWPGRWRADEYFRLEAVLARRLPFHGIELAMVEAADGGRDAACMRISAEPFLDAAGQCAGFICCAHDVSTARRERLYHEEMVRELRAGNRTLMQQSANRNEAEEFLIAGLESRLAQHGARLHDDIAQTLAALALHARRLENAPAGGLPAAAPFSDSLAGLAEQVTRLARLASPAGIEYDGLISALRWLAGETGQSAGPRIEFDAPACVVELPVATANHVFRIVEEALHNALRHSGAEVIDLKIEALPAELRIVVRDNGRGLTAPPDGGQAHGGMRLMRVRARIAGILLRTGPAQPAGTEVMLRVPLPARAAALAPAA